MNTQEFQRLAIEALRVVVQKLAEADLALAPMGESVRDITILFVDLDTEAMGDPEYAALATENAALSLAERAIAGGYRLVGELPIPQGAERCYRVTEGPKHGAASVRLLQQFDAAAGAMRTRLDMLVGR